MAAISVFLLEALILEDAVHNPVRLRLVLVSRLKEVGDVAVKACAIRPDGRADEAIPATPRVCAADGILSRHPLRIVSFADTGREPKGHVLADRGNSAPRVAV